MGSFGAGQAGSRVWGLWSRIHPQLVWCCLTGALLAMQQSRGTTRNHITGVTMRSVMITWAPRLMQPAFGATSAFGGSSSPAFGAPSTPAFGASSPFGSSTPAFGAAASTPAFGAASTPAFGATSSPLFGAASSPAGAFGSAPSFGSPGGGSWLSAETIAVSGDNYAANS